VSRAALGAQSKSLGRGSFKVGSLEDPRAVFQRMQRVDLASLRSDPERPRRDADERSRVAEVKPGFDTIFFGPMHGDSVVRSKRRHSLPGPSVPVAGFEAVAIEDTRNDVILGNQRKLADRLDDVGRCAVALSATAPRQAVLGMHTAHPVDDDDDLGGRVVEISDRLPDHCPHDPLLQASVARRSRPDRLKVSGEGLE